MPIIELSQHTFSRLEALASGFTTPEKVIQNLLDLHDASLEQLRVGSEINENEKSLTPTNRAPSENEKPRTMPLRLSIVYYPNNSEEQFKAMLLSTRKAFIKKHFINGNTTIVEWTANSFSENSSVYLNLKTGRLRFWRQERIWKAEVSTNRADFEKED